MSEEILNTQSLTRRYGAVTAVDQLSISVRKGTVYGLLGPNGSGKTTLLSMVLGVIRPDSGSFTWFGSQPSPDTYKRVGTLLETPNFYPHLSGENNLKISCMIKGASYDRIREVLTLTGLEGRGHHSFRSYSLGMKQRLAIAAALLNEPEVLVLDEPTNGLDPKGIAEVRELIKEIASRGVTVLLASHLLDEVERVCTEVAILKKGSLLYQGNVDGLRSEMVTVKLAAPDMGLLVSLLESYAGYKAHEIRNNVAVASFDPPFDGAALNRHFFENGLSLSHLETERESLEKTFLKLVS
ncbi:ABC transporter ATP-binding protein [Roseivirga sp. BDSF3-8]|uniref:ABC transporter ATP-binding protein n=1 Tax=Roseivirga sp. BDSF3-8 TaxID=3241598 RepID=UPI003531BE09